VLFTRAVGEYLSVPMTLDQCTPTVTIQIQGIEQTLFVDWGSSRCLLHPGVAQVPIESTAFAPFGVTGRA
jgi:hypothetical protein